MLVGIRNLIRNKQLNCYYLVGNRYYFKKTNIENWISQQENNIKNDEYKTKIKALKNEVS